MSGVGAKAFTFQLSSRNAEKTGVGVEQYRLQLEPGVQVPFTAQPQCQLEQLAFTMTVTNVDAALYNNNKIVFEWDPFIPDRKNIATPNAMRYSQVTTAGDPKQYTMTVPDGTYSLLDLEVLIARELYQKTDAIDHYGAVKYPSLGSTYTNLIKEIRPTSGLFWDMDVMAKARPDAAGATVTVANGLGPVPAMTTIMNVVAVRQQIGTEYVGGVFEIGGVKRRIVWISTEAYEDNHVRPDDDPDGSASVWANLAKTAITVDIAWGKTASHGQTSANGVYLYPPSSATVADTSSPTVVDDAVDFLGYGAAGVAFPTQQPTSGWGTAYSMDELQVIAHTAGSDAISVAPTFVGAEKLEQNQRKIKPVTLSVDPVTHKIQATCASPMVKVTDESTLFSDLLGYSMYTGATRNPQNMLQLPPASDSARLNLAPWVADSMSQIQRTKAIEFHCPTLVTSSYDQKGKQSGGSLAQVPITKPRGQVEVWQAAYDNGGPIDLHGGVITSLTYSLSNQDGDPVNLQGSDFNATLRISWPDPVPPAMGSAGADAGDAYGLRDVKYVS